jgi:hypothetical protein
MATIDHRIARQPLEARVSVVVKAAFTASTSSPLQFRSLRFDQRNVSRATASTAAVAQPAERQKKSHQSLPFMNPSNCSRLVKRLKIETNNVTVAST